MGIIVIYFMRPVEEKGTLKEKKMPISVFLELVTTIAIEIISPLVIDEFNLLVLKTHPLHHQPSRGHPCLAFERAVLGGELSSE